MSRNIYFPREFLLVRACRDDFSMAFCEVLVSEIGQEHKIPWLLHQWYTWEHKPSGIYPNCTSPMKRTEEIFSLWSQNRCKNFCFLWFLCFLESFSFLPVLAFPIYALKYVVLCMSPLNICAAWHTVYYQESNFLKKTLFIVFGVKLRILLQFPVDCCAYLLQIWH